jgi:uncharacterized protein YodC (DUF2158 family)
MTTASKLILLKDFLPPFKIGDKVRLKSGGPPMTVTACIDGQIEVQWFDGESRANQCIYPPAALRKM